MNNKEAAEVLKDIDKAYRAFSKEEYKALELAIKALTPTPIVKAKWEVDSQNNEYFYTCSKCGSVAYGAFKHCPKCIAYMENWKDVEGDVIGWMI